MSAAESNPDPLLERCAAECLDRGWRLAWLMLRHREDAADAVQSAFVVALRKRRRIPPDNPWPWLSAVIAREAMHIRRKRARAVSLDTGGVMPIDPRATEPQRELERREGEQQVARALDELPADERDALLLTQLGGLTYAQAAQALSIPLGTLNHRVSRALAGMRRKLREDEPAVARALAVLPVLAPPFGLKESLEAQAAGAGTVATVALGGLVMKKTTALIGALILVLLLGVGAVTVMTWPEAQDSDNPPVSKTETRFDSAAKTARTAPSWDAGEPDPILPAITPPSNAQPVGLTDKTPAQPSETPARRVLVAKDSFGKAVSVNFVVDWRVSNEQPWVTQRVKTEADGRAQLDAPIEATVRMNLTDSETTWILAWRDVVRKGGDVEAPITVYAPLPLRLRVIYSDNQPYVGLLTIEGKGWIQGGLQMVEAPGDKEPLPRGWPAYGDRSRMYGYHEYADFGGVPAGIDIKFGTVATRTGYGEVERLVTAAEIASGKLIEIVVPPGVSPRTPANIVIIPPEGEKVEGDIRLYKVNADGSKRTWGFSSPGGTDRGGTVQPGRYTLIIFGARPWASAEFDVAPGETKELRPVFTEPASLRARVLDVDGNAVSGAVLLPATMGLPRTINRRTVEKKNPSVRITPSAYSGEAETNAEGVAVLTSCPVGTFRFQVYAVGFQPWEGFVTLAAGQEQDLGDVRIERAAGRVEAQFPDWDFTKRKLNWAIQDELGGGYIVSGTITSSKLVIEGLPVGRTYSLRTHIPTSRGLRAFWYPKPFELTSTAPSKELDGTSQKWPDNLD